MGAHLDKVGRSLGAAVGAYNQALGSLESRVLVTARRFNTLGMADRELVPPSPLEAAPRSPTAAELVADPRTGVADPVSEPDDRALGRGPLPGTGVADVSSA